MGLFNESESLNSNQIFSDSISADMPALNEETLKSANENSTMTAFAGTEMAQSQEINIMSAGNQTQATSLESVFGASPTTVTPEVPVRSESSVGSFCSNCGNKVNSNFCTECGTPAGGVL